MMKKLKTKKRIILPYTLYGIVLTVALLYICFPSDVFTAYVTESINKSHPRIQSKIHDVRPALPYGIKLLNPAVFLKQMPDVKLFETEKIIIRPEILSWLKGNSGYTFKCDAYDGNVTGNIRFKGFMTVPPFSLSLKLDHVNLNDYDYLSKILEKKTTGALNGAITFRGLTDGKGEANIKVSKGSITLSEPFFDLKVVEFDELLAKLILTQNKIECAHIKLSGPEVQGTLSGAIWMKRDFSQSNLDLKGTIEIPGGLLETMVNTRDARNFLKEPMKIPFSIQGTIIKPEFNFS